MYVPCNHIGTLFEYLWKSSTACNFSELSILDCDFIFSNVCLIYYIPVSMHVALTADLSKVLRKSSKIYKATPGGRRLPEREAVKTGGGPKPPELKDEEEKVSHKICIINNHCA